jgi:hypothetical protein
VVDLHPPRRVRRLGGDSGRDSAYDPGRFIAAALWRFSETMPEIPHEYMVRGLAPDEDFDAFVRQVHELGHERMLDERWYRCLEVGGWHYLVQGTGTGDTSSAAPASTGRDSRPARPVRPRPPCAPTRRWPR